jgi:hypothetical protein
MFLLFARRATGPAVVLMALHCGSSDAPVGPPAGTGGGNAQPDGAPEAPAPDAPATMPDAAIESGIVEPTDDAGACEAVVESHPDEGALHLNRCDPTTYMTNPPSSGNHYGDWALYQTYTTPFRSGFWVHNLEHGAVVITYNCPGGCPAEVAQVQALIDSLDNDCAPLPKRIVLLPDPDLDVRFAASAWTFTIKAPCFNRAAFAQFIADHYGHGREDICQGDLNPVGLCP